jgi:hypothetical protein
MSDIWTGIMIGLATSIVGGLILTVLIIVFRVQERIQNWLDQRALSNKGKRLKQLQEEYERVKKFHDDRPLLNLEIAKHIINSLAFLFLVMVALSAFMLAEGILSESYSFENRLTALSAAIITMIILLVVSAHRIFVMQTFGVNLTRLLNFEQYEKDTTARIEELKNGVGDDEEEVRHWRRKRIFPKNSFSEKALTIHSAEWGAKDKWEDVTHILKEKVSENRLEMKASKEILGDPIRGTEKILKITFSYGNHKFINSTFAENDTILLPGKGILDESK